MKRLIVLLGVIWVFMAGQCPSKEEREFQRNPDLELFMSPGLEQGLFQPIYSPQQDRIFFIKSDTTGDGLSYVLLSRKDTIYDLVGDSVITYAVSHTGNEIIYAKGGLWGHHWEIFRPVSKETLVRIDASTGSIIEEINVTPSYIWHIEYLSNDSSVIYSGSDTAYFYSFYSDSVRLYFLNLYTKEESLITTHAPTTFTLINDSVFYDFSFYYPQTNPINSNQILKLRTYPLNDELNSVEDIILVDLTSHKETSLNAKPYYWTSIPYASWSPDGHKIVFSAAKPLEDEGPHMIGDRYELWILNLK